MARTGMTTLISTVRGMTETTPTDYTVGTINFWNDDEVQRVLDRHRLEVNREQLVPREKVESSAVQYYEYYSKYGNYEQTTGGTAIFIVEDSTGADAGTALWSADYAGGIVTFANNTGGTVYYLTGRSYDLKAAAAEIWRMKGGHYYTAIDITTDAGRMARNQIVDHCFQMAAQYEKQAPVQSVFMERSDT